MEQEMLSRQGNMVLMMNLLNKLFRKEKMKDSADRRVMYQNMDFQGLKFQYLHEKNVYHHRDNTKYNQLNQLALEYEREVSDHVSVYKNKEGQRAVVVYQPIPTFDSSDREWNSYRKLYLIPIENGVTGLMVVGGYNIAKIDCYTDIRWNDEKTRKLMIQTGVF